MPECPEPIDDERCCRRGTCGLDLEVAAPRAEIRRGGDGLGIETPIDQADDRLDDIQDDAAAAIDPPDGSNTRVGDIELRGRLPGAGALAIARPSASLTEEESVGSVVEQEAGGHDAGPNPPLSWSSSTLRCRRHRRWRCGWCRLASRVL